MKKRLAGTIAVLLLLTGSAGAAGVRLEFKAGYFQPSDKDFRDIYGGGPRYGGEVCIGLWKGFDVWLGGSYFSKTGELTFTKEKTELRIVPIGVGLKYSWTKGVVRIYTAAGLSSFQYKESNPIGDFSKSGAGLTAELGSYVRIAGGLLVDVFVGFSHAEVESEDFDVPFGGVSAGLGLAYQF